MNKFRGSRFLLVTLFVAISFSQALSASVESGETGAAEAEVANELSSADTDAVTGAVTAAAAVAPKVDNTEADANRGRLISTLFQNYDKRNYHAGGVFKFGLALVKIDVDEEAETVEAHGWFRMNWSDPRLKWNPEEYGGQTVFRLPVDEVWKPDISLYNSADPEHSMRCRDTNVLVYNDGHILWVPSCRFDAICSNLTLHRTPYAEQECLFKFGSWTFDGSLLDLQNFGEEKVDLTYFSKSANWNVLDTSDSTRKVNYYSCCKEPYVTIDMVLRFQRRADRPSIGCSH